MALPTFLGIGAQRSGTTWLYTQLMEHTRVLLPRWKKEVHFFDRYYERGLSWYESQIPKPSCMDSDIELGEITPAYLYNPNVPRRIHKHLPNCKLIAILRHPVERAFSEFTYAVQRQAEQRSFLTFLQEHPHAFARGLYDEQIRRYLELFSREQLLILIFEELMANKEEALTDIAEFLGISADCFSPDTMALRVNRSRRVRLPSVYASLRKGAQYLRSHGLDALVELIKGVGLNEVFFREDSSRSLDYETYRLLHNRYSSSIGDLEEVLGRRLEVWWKRRNGLTAASTKG